MVIDRDISFRKVFANNFSLFFTPSFYLAVVLNMDIEKGLKLRFRKRVCIVSNECKKLLVHNL